jgi:hypothetical protein
MFSLMSRVLAAAAVVTTAGLVPAGFGVPGAVAPAGWEPPVGLSQPGLGVVASQAVVSPLGDQAVVWVRGGEVRVALRPAGDTWARAVTIGSDAGSAVAAYDIAGRLMVVWAQHPDGAPASIQARTLGPAGAWGDPAVVAQRDTGALAVSDLAVNGAGEAVLAWQRNARGLVARGTFDGGWATTLRVPHAGRMKVSVGDGGLAAVVAQQIVTSADDGLRLTWVVVRQQRGSAWGDPTVLQRLRGFGPPAPGLGGVFVDRDNRTTVAWDARRPDGGWAVTTLRARGVGAWHAPHVLSRQRSLSEFPILVTGTQPGRLLVTFAGPRSASVLTARWNPTSGWSGTAAVTGAASYVNDWSVAMEPSGRAVIVWTRSAGPGSAGQGVRAALLAADGTWSAPVWLSREETPDGHARFAAMADGTALAVWSEVTTGRKVALMARSRVG